MKENKAEDSIWDGLRSFLLVFLFILVFKLFVLDITMVNGISMENTLQTNDLLLVDKLSKNFKDFEREDVVIIDAPYDMSKFYIKRVVGLPGEKIDLIDGNFYINGLLYKETYTKSNYTYQETQTNSWTLGEDEYFVVGDNRLEGASSDSRYFGPVSKDLFEGKVFLRIYPFDKFGKIE